MVGGDGRDPCQAARGDAGRGELVDELDRRPQRDGEERRVAEEGDELPRADVTPNRQVRTDAHDDEHEDARQQDLRRLEQSLDAGQPNPGGADATGLRGIPPDELLLAPDAAQDAQTGNRVGPQRRQRTELGPLLLLSAAQSLHDQGQ